MLLVCAHGPFQKWAVGFQKWAVGFQKRTGCPPTVQVLKELFQLAGIICGPDLAHTLVKGAPTDISPFVPKTLKDTVNPQPLFHQFHNPSIVARDGWPSC